jgi:hypothetical protein
LNGQLDRELDLSIEGFHVSADEAVAIVTGQEPPMLDDESRQASPAMRARSTTSV